MRSRKWNDPGQSRVANFMTARLRPFALMFALTAMLLRGLLPAGWMPAADAGAPLVICTGHGATHLGPVRPRGHTLPGDGPVVCPFASAAHLSLPLAIAPRTEPTAVALNAARTLFSCVIPLASIFRPQSPRAPPHFA
jgi:hypothetical protein